MEALHPAHTVNDARCPSCAQPAIKLSRTVEACSSCDWRSIPTKQKQSLRRERGITGRKRKADSHA